MDIFDGDFFCESEFSPIPLISALSTEVYAGVSPQCVGSPRCVFFFMTLREGNVQALQRIGPGRASALSYCFTHVFLSGKNLGRPSIAAWLVARCLQPQLVTTARVALVSRPGWSLRGAASAGHPGHRSGSRTHGAWARKRPFRARPASIKEWEPGRPGVSGLSGMRD